jgi:pimeloyl-ACP methyl ester carboxylesterase
LGEQYPPVHTSTWRLYDSIVGCIAVFSPAANPFSTGVNLVPPTVTRVGDLTVAVQRAETPGSKPPVLLLHGMFGGAWYWANYQSLLARRGYESHALNLRGHHGSRPVPDIGTVALSDYVRDALDVARTLGNPIVIGHSMGGLIAQKVAESGMGRALVLIGSAPPRWITPASWILIKKQLKFVKSLLLSRPIFPSRPDADALMFNRTPLAERDAFFRQLVPESGHAGLQLSIGAMGIHASRVTAPVLVMTGRDDQFVVPRVARALARKYAATLREYDTFAHHIICEPGWEKPCAEMIEWLDTNAHA